MKKILKDCFSKLSKSKLYFITFIASCVVISILYQLNDVSPFGDKSLLCIDFYHQYGPMLAELFDRIHAGSNLIYSFNMGLGLPFFRNFLNYLSSPFNIIMFFFNRSNLITSYSYIIGLKAVVSSVTMVYYLSYKFKTKDLWLVPLGIIYAFCAYFDAYYWDLMWLDGMVFLPLITLGIEKIVNEGKWKSYTIWLAIMLLANYFIGYMICIYSVIYFIIYDLYKTSLKKGHIKYELKLFFIRILKFGIGSILAGCLVAVFLIPMYLSMKSISATGGVMPTSQYYGFTLEDFLKYHLTGVTTSVLASDPIDAPNVSVGILGVALLLVYIINLDIPLKNKLCYLSLLGFFILAFFWAPLDYILHAFHVPNDLPYRYSFIYSFILVIISAYSMFYIKKNNYSLMFIAYLFLMALLLSISKDQWEGSETNMIYINMILLTLYFVFYSGTHFIKNINNVFYIATIAIACVDVIVSINYNWDITQVLDTFYEDYDSTEELLNYVKNQDDSKFYRIENTQMMTLNDASWYNYYGMTTFSSMAYESLANLQHNLGMPGNEINSYYYVQSTPIYDLMFDMKYFIGITNDDKRYTEIKTIDETANRFKYDASLAYGVNKDIKNWEYNFVSPFDNQNNYIENSTGINNVLTPSKLNKATEIYNDGAETIVRYEYDNPNDNMYFYTDSFSVDFFIIGDCLYYKNDNYSNYTDVSDELYYSYLDDYNESKIVNIKSSDKEVYVYVAYNTYAPNEFSMYEINNKKFLDFYDKLYRNKLDIRSFKENKIEGSINLEDDMSVYTSIPFDEGWHVIVDGNKVNTFKIGNALLGFDVNKGVHDIILYYRPKGFIIGLIISISSLIILIIDKLFHNKIFKLIKKIKFKNKLKFFINKKA